MPAATSTGLPDAIGGDAGAAAAGAAKPEPQALRKITRSEIDAHNKDAETRGDDDDVWFVLHGRVLAMKEWARDHPGGELPFRDAAASSSLDATEAFEEQKHSKKARLIALRHAIGVFDDAKAATYIGTAKDPLHFGAANGNGHANGKANGKGKVDFGGTAEVADASETRELLQHLHNGEDEHYVVDPNPVLRLVKSFWHLFFSRSFQLHRLFGLAYLFQYAAVCYLWVARYDDGAFLKSPLIITMPVCGALQSLIAIYTFTFLPKKQVDGGYFSGGRSGTMSYPFIKENFFFASLLAFQWLYYNPRLYPTIQSQWWCTPVEYAFVFLPYVFRRQFPNLFPKTSFRFAHDNMRAEGGKGQVNLRERFYWIMLWITRVFYIWAKHYIGFFLNYVMFIYGPSISAYNVKWVYQILVMSCFATTISLFLHTLRFKGYFAASVSMAVYVISYMCTFIGFAAASQMFVQYWELSLLTAVGLFVNLISVPGWDLMQLGIMAVFHVLYRHNVLFGGAATA